MGVVITVIEAIERLALVVVVVVVVASFRGLGNSIHSSIHSRICVWFARHLACARLGLVFGLGRLACHLTKSLSELNALAPFNAEVNEGVQIRFTKLEAHEMKALDPGVWNATLSMVSMIKDVFSRNALVVLVGR